MEDIELRNRELPPEEEDPALEEETSFTEADNETLEKFYQNQEMPDAPEFEPTRDHPRLAAQRSELERPKRQKEEALKKYIKKELGISSSPTAGEKSRELYDKSELIISKKSGKVVGLEFEEKRVIVNKNKFSKNRTTNIKTEKFKNILKEAQQEYQNTTSNAIEKENNFTPSIATVQNVSENTKSDLDEKINELKSEAENTQNKEEFLSPEEIREANSILKDGVFNQNNSSYEIVNALETEKKYWKDKKLEASSDPRKQKFSEIIEKIIQFQIDKFYTEDSKIPKSEEGLEILREEIRNNDHVRFEKFKKWAKENLLGLSAVAITIGGIITTVLVSGRHALKQGASAFAKFAHAVAKVAAKAGPLLSSLLGIIATALKAGAKGIVFISNNLWILAVTTAYAIAESRRKAKLRK